MRKLSIVKNGRRIEVELPPSNERVMPMLFKGGAGSGNFGHAGRPGMIGGSGGGGDVIENKIDVADKSPFGNIVVSLGAAGVTPAKLGETPHTNLSVPKVTTAVHVGSGNKPEDKKRYQSIYDEAHNAGMKALQASTPTPMVVYDADPRTGAPVAGGKQYYESEGACGFAWVNIRPASTSFSRYLSDQKIASKDSYEGGMKVWVSQGGQSITRKEAYASAFADALRTHGVKADAGSRLD